MPEHLMLQDAQDGIRPIMFQDAPNQMLLFGITNQLLAHGVAGRAEIDSYLRRHPDVAFVSLIRSEANHTSIDQEYNAILGMFLGGEIYNRTPPL